MKVVAPYTRADLDKIGNSMIYMAQRIQPLSRTKLLKLLYLLEESSVKKYGMPFLNLSFQVWKFGPVAKDIFIDLSSGSEPTLFDSYIDSTVVNGTTTISARKGFVDDEFSDNEIELLDFITEKFKNVSAEELVKLTHREHGLWHKAAKDNGVLEYFENDSMNSTAIEIDFSQLLLSDQQKYTRYLEQTEFVEVSRSLKF
ncbi:Panacea domain-containing protein [Emticicia sp. 21SJ11W-3]|uniref:Panacea domain-containing protein n=1 Tax=Emticicia sp. 21SJ11W-3 TaxID=2916755 RepID=UPI00209FFC4C|nr:Panacea domain-containing protein [Emticicia sp. 21SJ11W-3]UTA66618.1 SocA family protein [Emticicia sp. 21SJ11W-3]